MSEKVIFICFNQFELKQDIFSAGDVRYRLRQMGHLVYPQQHGIVMLIQICTQHTQISDPPSILVFDLKQIKKKYSKATWWQVISMSPTVKPLQQLSKRVKEKHAAKFHQLRWG